MDYDATTDTLVAGTREWLHQLGLDIRGLSLLPGDVSLRRYFRADLGEKSAIVALYPPEIRSSCKAFLITTRLLSAVRVRVPEVLASDCDHGYTLIEDVGASTLYDLDGAKPSDLRQYFLRAVTYIAQIQSVPGSRVEKLNPPLDGDLLREELRRSSRALFEPLAIPQDPVFFRELEEMLDTLCGALDQEPAVPCHRDFMARNLVPAEPFPDLAVLDHQDLRLGPGHYDLASVLNDSLFPTAVLEEEILGRTIGDHKDERIRYHRAAAQRTLKATGTYLMFAQRGFDRHRKLVPATLVRSLHHLARLPEASNLCDHLEKTLKPLLPSSSASG